jgi:glycosyltransferase involved in cell wall biosynthesis
MFSIVIPLYNKADYILKAVNSALTQTFKDFEIIVVNDGSTDDSVYKIENFKDARLKIINQENAGVSTARNNGVKEANFDYVAFLDADDWWNVHFLEEMKLLIGKYPAAGIYGCNYYYVKNRKHRLEDKGLEKDFTAGYIDYFKVYAKTFCAPFNCSFVIVDKAAFNAVGGFKSQLKFGEDFDLWIRIALKHKVAYLNKPLAYSNQDVENENRALGINKLYDKDSYYIFNLSYLGIEETKNKDLKNLLDGLRVRSLLRYYLNKTYRKEVNDLLSKVDFNKQPLYFRLVYKLPVPIVKLYFAMKSMGSIIKQSIIRNLR